jgi:AraC-like DNA-binding protein
MNIVGSGTSATKIPDIISKEQGKSIFAGLDSGTDTETGSLVSGSLKGMLSGNAYAPYEQQSQEKLARAAQNLRTSVGSSYANKMNQGSANKAMNQADQNIFSSIADTNLNLATEKQAMKERGITAALDVGKAQDSKRLSDLQAGMQAEAAYGYTDSFGNIVRGVNANSDKQVDIAEKQANTAEKVATANIEIDQAKLAETARQFNISTDQAQRQFNETLKKDYAQLSSQEKQFLQSLGLDQAKFEESKKQFTTTISLDKAKLDETARQFNISSDQANKQFYDSLTKDYAALSQNDKQFLSSLGLDQAKFEEIKKQNENQNNLAWSQLKSSEQIALKQIGVDESKLAETARQFNISTEQAATQFKDTMRYNYEELSTKDRQFLQSLGLDQSKFEYQKIFDRNSLQFNYDQLSTNSKLAYDKMGQEDKQFYSGLNSNEKMAYEQMNSNERIAYQENQTKLLDINSNFVLAREGIVANQYIAEQNNLNNITIAGMKISADQDIARMQINSAETLAKNSNYLTQQGIDLQEAALKGFTDKDGNHVMGSQEIASQELGLKATELDLMKKELLGDPATGLQGKLAIMNDEQKLKAQELIGYDKTLPDGSTVHVNGTLEAQQAQVDIQKLGLDLDKERFTDSKVRDNYSIALAAGDYAGANKIANEAGIPSVDYTKQEDREALQKINESMNNAKEMLAMIGDSATPEQIQQFATIYAQAWSEKEKLLGVPFEEEQLDNIIKSFETNTDSKDNQALSTYVSSTVMDWWTSGEGMIYSGDLGGKYNVYNELMANGFPNVPEERKNEIAAEMGQLVWSRYAASAGKYLTSNQINMLTEAGLISDEEKSSLPQSLIAEKEATEKTSGAYTSATDKLSAAGVAPGILIDMAENQNVKTLKLNRSEINSIIDYETKNPKDANYLTDINIDKEFLTNSKYPENENLFSDNYGKIIKIGDSYMIPLGMSDIDNRTFVLYNVSTGQKSSYTLRPASVSTQNNTNPTTGTGGYSGSGSRGSSSQGNPGMAV